MVGSNVLLLIIEAKTNDEKRKAVLGYNSMVARKVESKLIAVEDTLRAIYDEENDTIYFKGGLL